MKRRLLAVAALAFLVAAPWWRWPSGAGSTGSVPSDVTTICTSGCNYPKISTALAAGPQWGYVEEPFLAGDASFYEVLVPSSASGSRKLASKFSYSGLGEIGECQWRMWLVGQSNAECTAASTPHACCTGAGAGTCPGMPGGVNTDCTASGLPDACCTGAGTGTCTGSLTAQVVMDSSGSPTGTVMATSVARNIRGSAHGSADNIGLIFTTPVGTLGDYWCVLDPGNYSNYSAGASEIRVMKEPGTPPLLTSASFGAAADADSKKWDGFSWDNMTTRGILFAAALPGPHTYKVSGVINDNLFDSDSFFGAASAVKHFANITIAADDSAVINITPTAASGEARFPFGSGYHVAINGGRWRDYTAPFLGPVIGMEGCYECSIDNVHVESNSQGIRFAATNDVLTRQTLRNFTVSAAMEGLLLGAHVAPNADPTGDSDLTVADGFVHIRQRAGDAYGARFESSSVTTRTTVSNVNVVLEGSELGGTLYGFRSADATTLPKHLLLDNVNITAHPRGSQNVVGVQAALDTMTVRGGRTLLDLANATRGTHICWDANGGTLNLEGSASCVSTAPAANVSAYGLQATSTTNIKNATVDIAAGAGTERSISVPSGTPAITGRFANLSPATYSLGSAVLDLSPTYGSVTGDNDTTIDATVPGVTTGHACTCSSDTTTCLMTSWKPNAGTVTITYAATTCNNAAIKCACTKGP